MFGTVRCKHGGSVLLFIFMMFDVTFKLAPLCNYMDYQQRHYKKLIGIQRFNAHTARNILCVVSVYSQYTPYIARLFDYSVRLNKDPFDKDTDNIQSMKLKLKIKNIQRQELHHTADGTRHTATHSIVEFLVGQRVWLLFQFKNSVFSFIELIVRRFFVSDKLQSMDIVAICYCCCCSFISLTA